MPHIALLIDTVAQNVRTVEVTDFRSIQEALGVDCFTCIHLENGETLYVDDEGLINGTKHGFNIDHKFCEMGFLMGRGLILGSTPQGGSKSTKLTVSDLKRFGITGFGSVASETL